ncbi:hypothetical protein A8C56_07915 [Niabella ginsenosidivorans]|uniref:HTH cro/C1-type domain-containing protein n=1 Tax=Niabella ginsenosidivorans TaxID=1176587 RepID=A0A1A9I0R4_9BACT|nr:helix-turn-helix transcriptional regulator [Niabella ginsenosidivorans]ANH80915.1 hypothetical protein A8C56_07915 [Niabella ginsenosidivorans]
MKKIRKALNLSQQELALLLNVSRSTIAMYEKGLRSLPSKASEIWCRVQLLWQQSLIRTVPAAAMANSHHLQQQQQALSQLNARVQRAAARRVRLTQQLTYMEEQHQRLGFKLYVLRHLMEDALPGSRQLQLLKNRELMTLIRLAGCCSSRRQLLAFQLQVLATEQKAALSGIITLGQEGALLKIPETAAPALQTGGTGG